MAGNSPNLGRDLDTQVHETHKSVNDFNLKTSSPRHIIIYLSTIKDKEKISKAARRKKKFLTYNGTPHKAVSRFLSRSFAGQERVGSGSQLSGGQDVFDSCESASLCGHAFRMSYGQSWQGAGMLTHSHNHTIPISRVSLRATSAGGERLLSQICFHAKGPGPGWQVDYIRTFPSRGHCGSSTQNGHIFWVWIYLPSPPWPVFIR